MTKVALLDDWQKIARRLADFGPLDARAEVTVFHDHELATPHLGYVTEDLYRTFYRETVAQVVGWLDAAGP